MTYDQAFKIGSSVVGYVKCTYAVVYRDPYKRAKGTKFAFQRGHTESEKQWGADENIITEELPIVKADYQAAGEYAPVELTKQAAALIDGLSKYPPMLGDQVYVKKTAIRWVPATIDGVVIVDENGNEIDLTAQIAAAKKRVDNAKAILAMATATIII